MRKTGTEGVVRSFLEEIIPSYGAPKSIESDPGTHFAANISKHLYKSLGIERNLHTPYHLQSSRPVERMNSTLKEIIARICAHTELKWPEALNLALWDVRNAPPQNHRMARFGRDLWRSSPTHSLNQVHLEQIA